MTTTSTPTIRLRPAPPSDPPYDDERHPDLWESPIQPLLELPAADPRSAARTPRSGGLQPQPAAQPRSGDRAPGTVEPAARTAAVRFVHICLEIVNGLRPAQHIRACTSPLEAHPVVTALTQATRRLQQAARGRRSDRRPELIKLRRMRTCQPRPGVLEIAAVIGAGDRVWAAAFRLEHRHGRWQCTAAAVL